METGRRLKREVPTLRIKSEFGGPLLNTANDFLILFNSYLSSPPDASKFGLVDLSFTESGIDPPDVDSTSRSKSRVFCILIINYVYRALRYISYKDSVSDIMNSL